MTALPLAESLTRLGTESAFEVLARARELEAQGRSIVHMEIGEPDFETPPHVRRAAAEALEAGHTHYVPSPGIRELREAIAAYVQKTRGVPVDPAEVVVTPGGKPIIFYTILATVNPGDEVIYPDPGFPIYESCVRYVGGVPVPIPLREDRDFRFDVEELRARLSPRTRLVILNSPGNPTGGALSAEDVRAIADMVRGRPVWVLSDEIYSRLSYGGPVPSILSEPGMKDQTVLLDGFSKTYAMTGWRLGWGVMPVHLAEAVTRLVINSVSCTAAFVQWAGIAALTGPQDGVDRMREEFRRRRDAIVAGLNDIPGVTCRVPGGAFYVFPNVRAFGMPSRDLARYLLDEAGVAVLGGTAFGPSGEGYLRLSYATSMANIEEALRRMRSALARLPRLQPA